MRYEDGEDFGCQHDKVRFIQGGYMIKCRDCDMTWVCDGCKNKTKMFCLNHGNIKDYEAERGRIK